VPTQTKKITIDSAAIFFGKIIGLLIGMVRLNYLASYLRLANFGILNFALYFCSLFQVLFDFGMSQLLTREIARDVSKSRELVGSVLLLKLIVVVIAGIVVWGAGLLLHFDSITNQAILLTTVVFAMNGISMVFLSAFQAHRKMTIISLSTIFNDLALSILVILLIQNSPYVATVLILNIGVSTANLLLLYFAYVRTIGTPKLHADVSAWNVFMKESMPIAISSIGISMYFFVGPTVLKSVRGDVEVGIYTAGYKLISILLLIPNTLWQIVYPIFSKFYSDATDKLGKSLNDALRIMLIIVFPLVIGGILLAPKIFSLLYTSEFSPGISVFQFSMISNLCAFLNWITSAFLLAVNRQKFMMITSMCIGVLTALVSIVIVPKYGYASLPFILIGDEFAIFIIHRIYLQKLSYGNLSIRFIVKPFAAALLMGATLIVLSAFNVIITVILGMIVYIFVLYLLRGFGEQEMELAAKLVRIPLRNKSGDSR
jgi:O-antigen/teichoic acid export membrane protein